MLIKVKGTSDIYGDDSKLYLYIFDTFRSVLEDAGFSFIRTPVFEKTELFQRAVGEDTDIIHKETYDFIDKGGRSLSLRPEGTASICRFYIENKMVNDSLKPSKFYYFETMYRYERPGAGRQREFTQAGCEVINAKGPLADAELIKVLLSFLEKLGYKNLSISLNSLGDEESRSNYRDDLVNYFRNYTNDLCSDCLRRLDTNPLRILDCKIDNEKEFFKNSPKISNYLSESSLNFKSELLAYLDEMKVTYDLDNNLVRGLDYYDEVVFEVKSEGTTICGGGRYNRLIKEIGGENVPAVGFALGVERLMLDLKNSFNYNKLNGIYIIAITDKERKEALKLSNILRDNNIKTIYDTENRSMKAQFKQADNNKVRYIMFINENSIKEEKYEIKDNINNYKEKLSIGDIIQKTKEGINENN